MLWVYNSLNPQNHPLRKAIPIIQMKTLKHREVIMYPDAEVKMDLKFSSHMLEDAMVVWK